MDAWFSILSSDVDCLDSHGSDSRRNFMFALSYSITPIYNLSTDPNTTDCGTSCSAITATNIRQHVLCMEQCVLPDYLGLPAFYSSKAQSNNKLGRRITPTCSAESTFFAPIAECIPVALASTNEFLVALTGKRTCNGGLIQTQSDLERLRFCQVVTGNLIINASSVADFTALFDIQTIQG